MSTQVSAGISPSHLQETEEKIKNDGGKNPTQHDVFPLFAALFLAFHPHEQPCSSDLPAGVPAAGLLQPGCGLWTAGSFVWHAHPVLHGCRGENNLSEHVTIDGELERHQAMDTFLQSANAVHQYRKTPSAVLNDQFLSRGRKKSHSSPL